VTGADLGQKQCRADTGWEGMQSRCGLNVCGYGVAAGKIFQIPMGAVQEQTKFQPARRTGL